MSDEVVDAVRRRFDGRAATYDESAMHRDLAVAVAEFVDVAPGAAVLDVATGTGLVLRALTAQGGVRPLRTAGVDVSPGMVEVARRHLPDATLVVADARRLPFPDASFDLVTACETVYFWEPARAFAEIARVLRPGGTFAVFLEASDPERARIWSDALPAMHVRTAGELSGLLAAAGFEPPAVHQKARIGWTCLVAKKPRGG